MRSVAFRPAAVRDVARLAGFIAKDSEDAAMRFIAGVESTVRLLGEYPLIGRPRPEWSSPRFRYRSRAVSGFPNHLVLYRLTRASVVVVRVVHGAQYVESPLRLR